MWQLDSDATSISSGSTAASTAHLPMTWGEADAGTSVPPSKLSVCARLKRPLRKSSPLSFAVHLIAATWVAMGSFSTVSVGHDNSRNLVLRRHETGLEERSRKRRGMLVALDRDGRFAASSWHEAWLPRDQNGSA